MELAGIEPASKQGNHTLSTRLFQTLIFVLQQDLDHQLEPYPLNFIVHTGLWTTIPDLPAPLGPWIRNNTLGATSRPATLWPDWALIYYASIRQREHTHCCQLIFWPNWFRSLQPSLRVLTYHLNLLSNPVNPKFATCKQPTTWLKTYAPISDFIAIMGMQR